MEGNYNYCTSFFIVSVFFSNVTSVLPFLEKFLIYERNACRPTMRLACFLSLTNSALPARSHALRLLSLARRIRRKKKSCAWFFGHLSEVISEDLTQLRARRERWRVLYGSSYNDVTAHSRVQAPVDQKVDRAIQRINYYPVDSAIGFGNTYPLDSELSSEKRHPTFEQPGPSKEV